MKNVTSYKSVLVYGEKITILNVKKNSFTIINTLNVAENRIRVRRLSDHMR